MCENTTDTKQQSDQIDICKPARVVFQANELVRGEQDNFTLLETKLIRLAISRITKNDKGITPFSCSITELARELKMKKQNIYREIDKLTDGLMKKIIKIYPEGKSKGQGLPEKKFHWIRSFDYKDGEISFRFSDEVSPYLLDLQKMFTAVTWADYDLPTPYAVRILEILESFNNLETTRLSVDWLKSRLGVKDKYKNTGDFIIRIIKPSVEAIKQNTSYPDISYKVIKKQQTITHIEFSLGIKKLPQKSSTTKSESEKQSQDETPPVPENPQMGDVSDAATDQAATSLAIATVREKMRFDFLMNFTFHDQPPAQLALQQLLTAIEAVFATHDRFTPVAREPVLTENIRQELLETDFNDQAVISVICNYLVRKDTVPHPKGYLFTSFINEIRKPQETDDDWDDVLPLASQQ